MHTQRTLRAWKFSFRSVPAHRILDLAFVSVRLESIGVSVARVTVKREEIEREQNPASRHFLERITAQGVRNIYARVAISLVPHLPLNT